MAAAQLDDIYETPKKTKGVFRVFSIFFYVFLALSAVIMCVVGYYGYQLYKELSPQVHAMIDYHPNEVTQVFDSKGRLVANLFDEEYRFYVKYDEIPGRIIEALLAVEDTMFFEHDGVNFDAIMRAVFKNVVNMRYMEGGSTLTQQLVKNMLLTSDRTLDRKLKEFLLSIRAEQVLTKEEILERYLNYIFLGHGYYGIKTAALGYFKKSLNELTLKEIAMLVGGRWHLLKVKDKYKSKDPVDGLDVAILQNHLLAPVLGIEDPKTDKRIDFVGGIRGISELERRVKTDSAVAFAMHPTSIHELFEVADAGLLMPPKSTWFEPKLRSGLFIHTID